MQCSFSQLLQPNPRLVICSGSTTIIIYEHQEFDNEAQSSTKVNNALSKKAQGGICYTDNRFTVQEGA